jgi:hypothetical protein
MTRVGKVARLPKVVRDELNRRLDNNEQGKRLVKWLNSLPEVQAVTKAEFGGKPIREQNLSEWKQGGYRDWQKHQERHEFVRELTGEAKDLESAAGAVPLSSGLSTLLLVEIAQAVRDALEETADAATRLERLEEVARRFAQLRREESNAGRAQLARERWERELADAEKEKEACGALWPFQALFLHKVFIESFGKSDGMMQELSGELIDALYRGRGSASTGLIKADPAESDQIRPDQTG